MTRLNEEIELVSSILLFSSSCLEETNRRVKNSERALKKLSDLKEQVLDTYRNDEICYETFCTLYNILNNTIKIIETTSWYFSD